MAPNSYRFLIILGSIAPPLLLVLLLFSSPRPVFSREDTGNEAFILGAASTRSHFLAGVIKKGAQCDSSGNNICNRVVANGGAALLYCCNRHCRDVLRDRNNCGRCGQRCRFGQLCCNGVCTSTAYSEDHCGTCNNRCRPGLNCDYGLCGYA